MWSDWLDFCDCGLHSVGPLMEKDKRLMEASWWERLTEGESEVGQSCLTVCDPVHCSPPGSSIHGVLQARILEWVAVSFSRGSSQPRNRTYVYCIAGRHFNLWAIREAWLRGKLGLILMGRAMFSKSLIQFLLMDGAVFPPCYLTWGQTLVEIMKITLTSFRRSHAGTAILSASNPAAGHHGPTPPWETHGHSWASLGQIHINSSEKNQLCYPPFSFSLR